MNTSLYYKCIKLVTLVLGCGYLITACAEPDASNTQQNLTANKQSYNAPAKVTAKRKSDDVNELNRSQLVILLYHHIDEDTPRATSTSPQEFADHLAYLKKHSFNVMPLKQALDDLFAGHSLPEKSVAITFDDGYRSIYQTAWPLLKRYNYPFTVFVDTQSIDDGYSAMMSWKQIKEMHKAGVAMANHSVTHAHLLGLSFEQALAEIDNAEKRLSEQLGSIEKLFAYPFGEHNLALADALKQKGYYGLAQYSGPASQYSNPQAIPRFSFSGSYAELKQFALKVNTRAMPLKSFSPQDPHLAKSRTDFELTFHELPFSPQQMNCFFQGEHISDIRWITNTAKINLKKLPGEGRSRINCTAPTLQTGVYYWQSIPIFVEPANGRWPD